VSFREQRTSFSLAQLYRSWTGHSEVADLDSCVAWNQKQLLFRAESLLPYCFMVITIVITSRGQLWSNSKYAKFGNSPGVVLPKEVINRLHTRDGEPLFLIEASEGGYLLTPYDPGFEEKMAKADDIISRYRNTLHVLAK
jgi:antitoxin component of MazEF toxin-antitoxin module